MSRTRGIAVAIALLATIASTLSVYPHHLAYFNELAGGPENGHAHLLASNLDWGQGLLDLDRLVDANPEWGPVAVLCGGRMFPEAVGSRAVLLNRATTHSSLSNFSHIAVSQNLLAADPRLSPSSLLLDPATCDFVRAHRPVARVAGSIVVYETHPRTHSPRSNQHAESLDFQFAAACECDFNGASLASASDINELSISGLLHVLLLHGLCDAHLGSLRSGVEALSILTDERLSMATFGHSPFVHTRDGLRYRLSSDPSDAGGPGESHRDQCLCTFAEVGVPIDHPIRLADGSDATVQALLSESISGFTYSQVELPWTAIAYAHYLPPSESWTNKFQRSTGFTELAEHLIDQELERHSCGGLHVIQAVEAILAADSRHGLLSRSARIATRKFIRESVELLILNQNDDGSWGYDWHVDRLNEDPAASVITDISFTERVVVTGHVVEFLNKTTEAFPLHVLVSGTRWIQAALGEIVTARSRRIGICPLTHALRALRMSSDIQSHSFEMAALFQPNSSNRIATGGDND